MNIYDIKRETEETSPHYFDRKSMKFFGQTMKDFKVSKQDDGRYKISAPTYRTDYATGERRRMGESVRFYNSKNKELERFAKGGYMNNNAKWEYPLYFNSEGKEYVAIYYSNEADINEADEDFDNRSANDLTPDVIKEHLGDNKWEERDVYDFSKQDEFMDNLEYALQTSSISADKVDYKKGGEVAEKETIVASYDINEYLSGQARYWKENKEEFIEYRDLDEEEAKEVDDDYIEKFIWEDEDAGEWLYEDLQNSLEEEFSDKIGKHVIVGGRNMGWRNLEGTKTFEIDNTEQMMREIVPENSDFTYYLYKTGDNNYSAKVSHHDSPMGEHYELHIMPQKYVDEFYEKWENEEAGMENYDEDDMGEWYKEEILSKKGMGGTLLTAAVAGYVGYKVGRARPQKTGFSTEKKIAAQIQKEMKEMQKKRAQKKRAKNDIIDVEFEEIKAKGGSLLDGRTEAFLSNLGDELGIDILYHADDLDEINSYNDLEEKLSESGAFDEDVIYYANAMKYLRDNDSSLNESLGLAADMGYECANLNSEILASILKSQNNREDFYEKRGEIEEHFGE